MVEREVVRKSRLRATGITVEREREILEGSFF